MKNLKLLDFQEYDILSWLAELMKHRDADTGRRYKVLAPRFIEKYQISTEEYDVIKGKGILLHVNDIPYDTDRIVELTLR